MSDANQNVDPPVPAGPPQGDINPPANLPPGSTNPPALESSTEGNSGEDQNPGGEDDQHAGSAVKKPIQPRINELVRKQREAEREAAYWRGIAEASRASVVAPAPAPVAAPKPVEEDFKTYGEYVDALTDWKSERAVEKALAAVATKNEERATQQAAATTEEARSTNWQERQVVARTTFADYDAVVGESSTVIQPHVAELLLESEHGPSIAYKLAQDPALADKLNKMDGKEATKAVLRMELAFEKSDPTPAPVSAPVVPAITPSKAPVPPTPVRTGASTSRDPSKMSMDEYVKARNAPGTGWAARRH